ncbi:MAG: L-lactate dehydrogenase (cytochrome), partial [Paracoccaceae bacterium]
KTAGADAIQVSSHGGRQLDCGPPPILALQAIRQALGAEFPLFYDTGLRSGDDVVRAYAMGADFVFFGRAMQYAIAAGGEDGLRKLGDVFAAETNLTLAQIGRRNMQDLKGCIAG